MAKYVIDCSPELVALMAKCLHERAPLLKSDLVVARAIPLDDYLAAQQPTPPANSVTVPLTVWIGPEGVTVAGFAPLPGFDGDSFPVAEIMIESGFVDSDMIRDDITASIPIPLPEPVTVVGKVEVTP